MVDILDSEASVEAAVVADALEKFLELNDPKEMTYEEFRGAQFDHGLAWVQFEKGSGGLGVSPVFQRQVEASLQASGAKPMQPAMFFMHLAGPTIHTHGDDANKKRFLRPMFTGQERWCQLFSEPGAGSDFAGLATRAIADGEEVTITYKDYD